MTSTGGLPNLHDATLLSVHVDWADGLATIELESSPDVVLKLMALGLREFSLTKREEWGPSVSVNGVALETNDAGELTVRIEMQSGDRVKLVAEQVAVMQP